MIKSLKTRLGALPAGGTPAGGVVPFEEKAGLDWMIRKIEEQKDKESLLAFLSAFCSRPQDTPAESRERGRVFLEECGGTRESVVKMAEETRPCYALAAKMLELPLGQFEKEFQLESKKRADNPVFKLLFPAVSSMRLSQARADVRRAQLATALDIQLDGPVALKNHRDPVFGGPFERIALDGGFELRSKYVPTDGKPWVLIVGQGGK